MMMPQRRQFDQQQPMQPMGMPAPMQFAPMQAPPPPPDQSGANAAALGGLASAAIGRFGGGDAGEGLTPADAGELQMNADPGALQMQGMQLPQRPRRAFPNPMQAQQLDQAIGGY